MPDPLDAYVMTTGGGKLSKSNALYNTLESHGYDATLTAADASHQNEIVICLKCTIK